MHVNFSICLYVCKQYFCHFTDAAFLLRILHLLLSLRWAFEMSIDIYVLYICTFFIHRLNLYTLIQEYEILFIN